MSRLNPSPSPAPLPLPVGVRSRVISGVNGLAMHLLEAGSPEKPCVLLLHGFPDLAFCWRKVLTPLADAGYYVIAPDLRGYGRTTGWNDAYHTDIRPFGFLDLSSDLVALIAELGVEKMHCLVGHDFGSPLAAYTALIRPDLIQRLVLMSAPFAGAPPTKSSPDSITADLLALSPPRKHYQRYYSQENANADMLECSQGLNDFLRAYFHVKSADWSANRPIPLAEWSAGALARMPNYYIMRADQTMPETVTPHLPEAPCAWLTDAELAVYAGEYLRTGFQGGLNWYRCSTSSEYRSELGSLHGEKITMPCWYIAGVADWGTYQSPGALERMQAAACTNFQQLHLVQGAGHWVQQEQPEETTRLLLDVLQSPGMI